MSGTGRVNESINGNVDECVNVITNNVNNNVVNIIVNDLFADQAMVDTGCLESLVDNNFCKNHNLHVIACEFGESISYVAAGDTVITAIASAYIVLTFAGERFSHNFQVIDHLAVNIIIGLDFLCKYNGVAYLSQRVFSLRDARIMVPLAVRGDTMGLTILRKQLTLQPNTQRIVRLNGPKINEKSVFLEEPILNKIGLVSIAQENTPAADIDPPCYLAGEEERDYPGTNGYRNRHRRNLALTDEEQRDNPGPNGYRNRHRIYLALTGEEQHDYPGPNGYRHRRYLADQVRASPTIFSSEKNGSGTLLIKHTYDEFKVNLTNTKIYDNYGDWVKVYRDVLI